MNVRGRTTCRLCYSPEVIDLFSLGSQFVSDFVSKEKVDKGIVVPIDLILCKCCGLVQLRHTAPQQLLYCNHYWYRSGVNESMCKSLKEIIERAESLIKLLPGDIVLDIGSNDGTLLRSYTTPDIIRVGVEPASNLVEEGKQGVDCLIQDMWNIAAYQERVGRSAKIVTAIGMFYDLEDPNQFVEDMAKALDKDGLLIAQLMCLNNMFNTHDVGNLAHEHLEFYSFTSLEYLFNRHGLEIFDAEINDVNGESYRIYVKHQGCSREVSPRSQRRIKAIMLAEQKLNDFRFYQDFFTEIQQNKDKVVSFIKQEVSKGKRVWVYGASTKGNVILQYYGLDRNLIEGAADRSPEKWGKYTIGTGIPIYSEEEARVASPDYFLVLPYAFLEQFLAREKQWRKKGGKFIVPLPKFRVV